MYGNQRQENEKWNRKSWNAGQFLKGGVAAVGMLGGGASSAMVAGAEQASADTPQPSLPDQILTAVQRFRETIPANFDREYVEKVVIPFFLTSFYEGERQMLPAIDVNFSKENALPYDLWGLITRDWRPTPEEGVTVFLQGLEKRGPDNLRKRIYFSAVTPDLYKPMYSAKVVAFFDKLMDQQFANKPFMRHYLDYYFDLYWDLHLGVTGDTIPFQVRQIGEAFNTVLAYRNPLLPITYDNYMIVRERLDFLKSWIDDRLADIERGKTKNPEKTIAWYWLKNAGDGSHFAKKDVVFECFHNFVALSQWGNSIFGIMSRLSEDGGDPAVRASFQKTMSGNSTTPTAPLSRHWNCSSWNYSALYRQMAEASRQSRMRGQAPMAHLRSKGLAFPWNAIATSAHPTQVLAWIPSTGGIRMLSIHNGILESVRTL